ncbi:hypothetical protein E4T56_gene17674 [Termitomyces sp. T112]|nr:hypothetical protein E4T56_gene17674 [Termitomyces sp. T112]
MPLDSHSLPVPCQGACSRAWKACSRAWRHHELLSVQHGPVALASSQIQPHFVQLGPCISNSMLSSRSNLTLFS